MTGKGSSSTIDMAVRQLTKLAKILPKVWGEDWTSHVEHREAYATATLKRRSHGFTVRLAAKAADQCTAKIVWPALPDGRLMTPFDWNVLRIGQHEPEIPSLPLTYNTAAIAKTLRERIIEPGTLLFQQAADRRDEAAGRTPSKAKTANAFARKAPSRMMRDLARNYR
ncbi:hypothetical protein FS815_25735 [Agrobacterium vitis]|uniref:hypothetical protein n=1 Tax=Allorhizobium ampelinum TaxID=3025782 RepID=UPI001F23A0A1|nr:hypothetical protein [Allorhizobium ampelinum]MCF1450193.1 hypothetical protein [Allorhizobium ampelinum]